MAEIDRLRELNARLQLVPRGVTVDELERNASAFTNEAAKLLHAEGWRRIRKTEGKHVDGLDIDKLVNVHTFELRDIVIRAGAQDATVGWLHVGELRDVSRFVEVRPNDPAPPVDKPPADKPPADDDDLVALLQDIVNGRDESNRQLDRIAGALEQLNKGLAAVAERFGIDVR